jgi:gliding motility-associated-like protein
VPAPKPFNLKHTLFLWTALCSCLPCFSQTFQWTWINGSNVVGNGGNFGTRGQAAPANLPGSRDGACSWTDPNGNFWLFGGEGVQGTAVGYLNDLWKYDPVANEWAWMSGDNSPNQPGVYGTKGVPSTNNRPSARKWAANWTDKTGNLWLFGGAVDEVHGPFFLNDLWMFNPRTGEWTWVAGSNTPSQPAVYGTKGVPSTNNLPPSMVRAIHWTDHNGIFWLYGGNSSATTESDLWKFDPMTQKWTWINGNHTPTNYPAFTTVYGTKKLAAPTNTPGGRIDAVSWVDASNNLWLFGASPGWNLLNDLWKYDPVLNEWIWISGDNSNFGLSVPGTQGVAAAANKPSCRYGSVGWADNNGKLWLFGGNGMGTNPQVSAMDPLNDLWSYDIATDQWTWVTGSTASNGVGVYGTMGTSAPGNTPGCRSWSSAWIDANNVLWLFGGGGFASTNSVGGNNDLWAYKAPSQIIITQLSSLSICPGGAFKLTFTATGSFTAGNVFRAELSDAQGIFGNPVNIGSLTAVAGVGEEIDALIPANTPGGAGYRVRIVSTNPAAISPDNGVDVTIFSPLTPAIQASRAGAICPGTPITLTASASGGNPPYQYSWSTGAMTQAITVNPTIDDDFIVSVTDGCGVMKDTAQIKMATMTPVSLGGDAGLCPNTVLVLDAHSGYASYLWQDGSTGSIFRVSQPGTYSVTVEGPCNNQVSSDAVVITAVPGPVSPFLPADTAVCQYGGLVVASRHPYSAYQWSTGQNTPKITIDQPGQYWLEVTDSNNCIGRDTIDVGARNCFEGFRMPNAFTPNGDGKNDVLRPLIFGILKKYRFQIFNRWGQKVFESTQLQQGWDGQTSGNPISGTFVWTCQYQLEGFPVIWAKGIVEVVR